MEMKNASKNAEGIVEGLDAIKEKKIPPKNYLKVLSIRKLFLSK